MTAPRRTVRPARTLTLGAVLALGLSLSACGANRDAQTYQERTSADASNSAVGTLALRGVAILPPIAGRTFKTGGTADAVLTVTNADDEVDTLVEVTTPAASSVQVLAQNRPATLRVPPLGSTGQAVTLRLVGLTSELREGEYVTFTFRFAKNGTVEVPVPVATSGRTDRPIYTGEEGSEEGEPALQAPAGGHSEEEHTETGEAEGEAPETGAGTEAEGTDEGTGEGTAEGAAEDAAGGEASPSPASTD